MKKVFFYLLVALLHMGISCKPVNYLDKINFPLYIPGSQEVHDAIVSMDSILFSAYNTCDMEVFSFLVSPDLEFYNDKAGLMTSKESLLEAIRKNICGKVTRELLKGSIEVYPIPDFGAVQMGIHRFYSHQEMGAEPSAYSKFVHTWRLENGEWKLTRVISLH